MMRFECNAVWLATGNGAAKPYILIPSANELGVSNNSNFIEVFDTYLAEYIRPVTANFDEGIEAWVEYHQRDDLAEKLKWFFWKWLDELEDAKLEPFVNKLLAYAEDVIQLTGVDKWENVLRRRQFGISLEEMREGLRALKNSGKSPLTHSLSDAKQSDMAATHGSLWKTLQARLRRAVMPRGSQAELARMLGVSSSAVAQWLADDKSATTPTAETTLRLLQWVEAEEAKQKSPGSASTPPEPKTRLSHPSYEKTKSGRKKS